MNKVIEALVIGIGTAVVALFIIFFIALLWSVITWWAWNAVMPFLFHLPHINLIQAFAINLLASLVKTSVTQKK